MKMKQQLWEMAGTFQERKRLLAMIDLKG